jgi:hypothetical protein
MPIGGTRLPILLIILWWLWKFNESKLLHKAGLVPSSSRPDVFETTVEDSVCNNIAQLSYFMVKR